MKVGPLKYVRAESVDHTLDVLASHDGEAKVLAGGQSLIPLLALRMAAPTVLVDLNGVADLRHKWFTSEGLYLSALVRHREVERDRRVADRFAAIADAMPVVGHAAIRNRGTVGGSLVHADAAAEWPALSLLFDAQLDIAGPGGLRTVAANDFFEGFMTTAVGEVEVLKGILFTDPGPRAASAFVELARRHGDFAIVGVGVSLSLGPGDVVRQARLALCGVAGTPHRALEAEALLEGSALTGLPVDDVAAAVSASISPPSDLSGSTRYRKQLSEVLTRRAITAAVSRLPKEEI